MPKKKEGLATGAEKPRRASAAKKAPGGSRDRKAAEAELDAALEQTFPASDPVSLESTLVPGGRR